MIGARGERLAHRRQVAVEELVLQRLGAGRDDHLAAGEQRRHEIGEGLAGAGAGLGHQHAAAFDRLDDRLRHLELLRARAIAGDAARRAGRSPRKRAGALSADPRRSARFLDLHPDAAIARGTPVAAESDPRSARGREPPAPPSSIHSPRRPLTVLSMRSPWIAPPPREILPLRRDVEEHLGAG